MHWLAGAVINKVADCGALPSGQLIVKEGV